MSHPDNWMPWDGDPKYPELDDEVDATEIPGQIDIFGHVHGDADTMEAA